MKKTVSTIFLTILLIGCGTAVPQDETAVSEQPTAVSEASPVPAATETEAPAPEPTVAEAETAAPPPESEPESESAETVVPEIVPVLPAEAAIVRDNDWVKGAENGRVVIIEYGDFQ